MSEPDNRREAIAVSALQMGMFVAELDRPWLGTPFLLQGFLLDDEKDLAQLQKLCSTVVIDRTLSTGEAYLAPAKLDIAIRRKSGAPQASAASLPKSLSSGSAAGGKASFFAIIKELTAASASTATPAPADPTPASTKPAANGAAASVASPSPASATAMPDTPASPASDAPGLMARLKGWLPRLGRQGSQPDDAADGAQQQVRHDSELVFLEEPVTPVEEEMALIYPVFEETQVATREVFEALANQQQIDLIHVNQSLDNMVDSIERNPDALMWLVKLRRSDDYAYNHALTVSINLMALGHFMALPRAVIKDLGLAGLLQDIGKVQVPEALLHKPGKLHQAELVIIREHVQHSIDMLNSNGDIPASVLNIVANHHERINGKGYPLQLKREQISLPAQMAGLIDTYCAMTSDKAYAKGLFNQHALEQIYTMRDQEFSSSLVDQLIQFFGIYPVSSLVELNTGEVAVVIQQNQVRRLQPRVMILLDADKQRNPHPATLDLIYAPLTPAGEPYRINKGLPPDSFGLNPADFYL